ncbi:MAG TPA: DoxX family protein [Candidatus Saccharimonadales bacterium]|nr:DoxX family protein [Candidatus Saccharimonadales bacterium]
MTAADTGLLIVRLVVGLTFAAHGAQKVLGWWSGPGFAGWTGAMSRMGLRPPRMWAALSSGVELGGGLLFAAGSLTPIAAALLVGQCVYIVLRVHLPKGFWNKNGGIEFPLQLLAGSLLIAVSGPGAIAIDPAAGLEFGVSWRAAFVVIAVLAALATMAIARPAPQPAPVAAPPPR